MTPEQVKATLYALETIREAVGAAGEQGILYADALHKTDDDKTVLDMIDAAITKATGGK